MVYTSDSSCTELLSLMFSHFLPEKSYILYLSIYFFIYLYSLPPTENWVAQSIQWLGYRLDDWRICVCLVVGTEIFLSAIIS
jgi:hypothetical protein